MYAHMSSYMRTIVRIEVWFSVQLIQVYEAQCETAVSCTVYEYKCSLYLTYCLVYGISISMTTPVKKKALLASGTLNPHPEAVRSELFKLDFFDPRDRAQVKYEMLRAHAVDGDPVAEACRQFGFSRESFYQIERAFRELGFSSLLPEKRGRKGPVKLKGEVLEFALEKKKENPDIDPGRLAALIQERYGTAVHRTTVMRGIKKKLHASAKRAPRGIRSRGGPDTGPL
jgi:transposase